MEVYSYKVRVNDLLLYGILEFMISATILLLVPIFASLLWWCQISILPDLSVVVVQAFEIPVMFNHPTRRYPSSGVILVATTCFPCKRRRMISVSVTLKTLAKINELEEDVGDNRASFHENVSEGSVGSNNCTISYTTSHSDVISSFNPFQYDASSVRMNHDRMKTMSSIRISDTTPNENVSVVTTTNAATNTLNRANTKQDHRISIRALTMKQIMNEMINTVPDYDKVRDILQRNKDFLLEVLDDDLAVQDDDSIYQNCTNRDQRYMAFQSHMKERIRLAQNPSVQQILICYHDFVMSHQ